MRTRSRLHRITYGLPSCQRRSACRRPPTFSSSIHSQKDKTSGMVGHPGRQTLRGMMLEQRTCSEYAWDRALTDLEVAAVMYELAAKYPNLDFVLDDQRTMVSFCSFLRWIQITCMETNQQGNPTKRTKPLIKQLMRELSGASRIVALLAENKKPLVTHNGALDLLHLYQYFIADLPGKWSLFLKMLNV